MAVEALVSVVIHELTNLLSHKSKTFEKVRDRVEKVLDELRNIQSISQNAENQGQSNKELQFLGKVYRAGDALESFALAETSLKRKTFVKKHSFNIANEFKLCREVPDEVETRRQVWSISRLKSEINRIREEVAKHKDLKQQQGSFSMLRHEPWQESDANRSIAFAPNKAKTISNFNVGKVLMEQLTSNSKLLQIISVFGEVGSTKRVHAVKIYNQLKKKFPCSALVMVNPKWSVRHLMMDILQQVSGLKDQETLKDDVLRWTLHKLLKDQKYLIIIIDINSHELLEGLRGALPDACKGSRVVITTSNEEAATFSDASNCFYLRPLDIEEGLEFFISKTWGQKGSPFSFESMQDLKKKLAESCKGILLRIGLLAGLLSTREENYREWSRVFEQPDFASKSPSFNIFVFCYNDLPSHLKTCLLYLTLFRKGFEIPVRRLFWLWLAEGFVKPLRGIIPEDVVEAYLEELVKRNIVEITKRRSDESPKKCRIIEDLHDIFLPRALNIGLFHLHQKSDEYSNTTEERHRFGIRRVVECPNVMDYSTSKDFNQNIQSYISFNGRRRDIPAEEVGRFIKRIIGVRGFGLLKVLDLEGVYRPRLPKNLGHLFHLRYLGLRWTFLYTLPSSIGSLLHLETLDIKHTHITTLPSSIWNMKHLHHLCLNGSRLDISAQSAMDRGPSQLQTLWGLVVDEKIARKIGFTLRRMTNLRKLDLTRQSFSTVITTITNTTATTSTTTTTSHSSSYEDIGSWISSLSSLQSLRLRSKDQSSRPTELIIKPLSRLENLTQLYLLGHLIESLSWYQFPPGLKVLTLSVSQLNEDPMPTLSQLPNLMVLRLLAASYVGEEMHCPDNGFPALRVLRLWKLEQLKKLTVNKGTMQKLHTMEIRCCGKLKELPDSLLNMKSFENLILIDMPESFASIVKRRKKKHTKIVEDKRIFK